MWTRLTPKDDHPCASDGCEHKAEFRVEFGKIGSYYCAECKAAIIELVRSVEHN